MFGVLSKSGLSAAIAFGLALTLAGPTEAAVLPSEAPKAIAVTATETVVAGTSAFAYGTLGEDIDVTATLETSTDGSAWTGTSYTMPIVDGMGVATWSPTKSAYFRLVGDGVQSAPWHVDVTTSAGYAISAGARSAQIHYGESVIVAGYAVKNGAGGAYRIKVQQRIGSGDWTTLGYVTSKSNGWWSMSSRPSGDTRFRASAVDSAGKVLATSSESAVDMTSGTTTITERRAVLGWRLGASTSAVHSVPASYVSAAKYTGGAKSARYQTFTGGMLVEVTQSNGEVRTWFLEARHLAKYKSLGYWKSALGLPERDAKCQLLEGGCVTLFSGGAIYTNLSTMSTGRYVAYGRFAQIEIVAAALSQRGYEEPSWRTSKYNDWIGGDNAWCQVFVAWATYAAGHQGEAPVKDYFPTYLSTMKASKALIRDPKASQIRAGDILIFDWGTGTASHTGFAVKVSGNYVYTIEGNTTDGTGDPQRGVYYRKRPISGIWGMYHPNEYKSLG